ncbi:hypothetical protein ACTXT7_006984 [Hymenolepis weldensis]
MADTTITNEMNRRAAIVSVKAKPRNGEITRPFYAFQQDSAPSHEALITWDWMTVGQDVVEKEVNKHPQNTKFSSPMEASTREMESINKDFLIKLAVDYGFELIE